MQQSDRFSVNVPLFRLAMVVLIALTLPGPAAVRAAETSPEVMTLPQCIEIALEKSPAVESADQEVVRAEWQKKKAFTGYLPKIGLQYSYTQIDHPPTTTIPYPSTTLKLPAPIGRSPFRAARRPSRWAPGTTGS